MMGLYPRLTVFIGWSQSNTIGADPPGYPSHIPSIDVQVVRLTAAAPPDVRQVSDLPGNATHKFRAAPALRGIAPIGWGADSRKATGLPHIGRRSRNDPAVDFIV